VSWPFAEGTAYSLLKNGFTIPGLVKLGLIHSKAQCGRNQQTGGKIRIPAKKVIKFRFAKVCKDAVLGKVDESIQSDPIVGKPGSYTLYRKSKLIVL